MSATNEDTSQTGGKEIAEYVQPDAPPRDAIGEEDNPIPLWFNVGFYGMIVFGIVYMIYYLGSGWSSDAQYQAEAAAFEAAHAVHRKEVAETNPLRGQPAAIAQGKQVLTTICAACHKPDATGLIGPSLVDPYWKYGHDDAALFETVSKGRPGGMPPWSAQLSDEKIWSVLAYLETLPRQSEPGVGAPAAGTASPPATP